MTQTKKQKAQKSLFGRYTLAGHPLLCRTCEGWPKFPTLKALEDHQVEKHRMKIVGPRAQSPGEMTKSVRVKLKEGMKTMKKIIAIAIAIAILLAGGAAAIAQDFDHLRRLEQESRRQQDQIEAQQRRMAEIERQQRAEQQRRDEAERWRINPLIPESTRQRCRPGQVFC